MAGWLAAGCLADTLCLNVMSSSRLQNVFVKFGFLTGRLGPMTRIRKILDSMG